MLELSGVNFWAIIVVWLMYMMVGAFWYSPAGFAKAWKRYTGIDIMKMPKDEANNAIAWVALSAFVQSLVLAVVLNSLHVITVKQGIITGLTLWVGLTAATTVGVTLYSRRSWKYLWLNSSYFLIVMTTASVIFATWK